MASAKPGTTTAWGDVYSDPEARPLKGVQVRLEPWDHGCIKINAREAKCPGYLPWHTVTNATGRFTLTGVPNGEYLLVIGTDLPSDLVHPTIHDHVTLTGGVQHLLAPNLPAIPCVDQAEVTEKYCVALASPDVTPFPRPEVEKNGSYRLATLDEKSEVPCSVGFDAKRATRHLAPIIVDEWLTENTRNVILFSVEWAARHRAAFATPLAPHISNGYIPGSGSSDCGYMLDLIGGRVWVDPRTRWFAGTDLPFAENSDAFGFAEYPTDPRVQVDEAGSSSVGPWP